MNGISLLPITIDRYGHLMDGLDDRTAARLDEIARAARGPDATKDVSRA